MMTVRMLISKLKKLPPTAYVGWQAHDQNHDELDGFVNSVSEGEPELIEACKTAGYLESDSKRKIVVLGT